MLKNIIYVLLFGLLTAFSKPVLAQKTLKCGLLTNFMLTSNSKVVSSSKSDIELLNLINNSLKVSSYMNKTVNEGSKKIIVSLFTTGTFDDFISQINSSKYTFLSKKTISKDNQKFACFSFKLSGKYITRVVFSEPDLTLCLAFDLIESEMPADFNSLYIELTNRISFQKVKK